MANRSLPTGEALRAAADYSEPIVLGVKIPLWPVCAMIAAALYKVTVAPPSTNVAYGALLLQIALGLALGWTVFIYIARRVAFKNLFALAEGAVGELDTVQNYLSSYLHDLDVRTSSFFHCATTTKIKTYFVLREMETAMKDIVEQCRELVRTGGLNGLLQIVYGFRGPFQYRSSLGAVGQNTQEMMYYDLPNELRTLIIDLDRGLALLEKEINYYNEQISKQTQPRITLRD